MYYILFKTSFSLYLGQKKGQSRPLLNRITYKLGKFWKFQTEIKVFREKKFWEKNMIDEFHGSAGKTLCLVRRLKLLCANHTLVKNTQAFRREIADELFDCVWLFCRVDA